MGLLVFSRWANQVYSNHKVKFTFITLTSILLAVICLGALVFTYIEGPHEVTRQEGVNKAIKATMAIHPGISEEVLNTFVVQLNNQGFDIPLKDYIPKWTFANTFLFCATLLTSIGYGHLFPLTKLGKAVAMVYSGFGIPLCLYVFSWGVSQIMDTSDCFKINLYYRFGRRLGTFNVLVLHFCITVTLILVGFFLFPAYLFTLVEPWSYLDSSYFIFITATTIGLGDMVPGRSLKHALVDLYIIASTIYLLIIVVLAMFLLALGTDFIIMVHKYRKTGKVPILVPEEKTCAEDSSPYGSVAIIIPEDNNNEEKKPLLP